jgi:hypothetical protein
MRLNPDAQNLLATALDAYRAEILPSLPPEKRYAALMIANALAMVLREIGKPREALPATAAALYENAAFLTPKEFEENLVIAIENGAFLDDAGERQDAFAALKAINAARLAITNPKLLPKTPA